VIGLMAEGAEIFRVAEATTLTWQLALLPGSGSGSVVEFLK
jgi:hypothetical protein